VVKEAGVPLRFDWRWRVLIALLVPWFILARWRIRVEGVENVPQQGGAIIAFNHHSYADAVMLAWGVVLKARRPLRYLAKREACEGRWIGWVTRWISVIPVDRGSPGARAQALSGARTAVEDGDLVAIAPEQTISDSLDLLPFRLGPARVAIATGAPIVPCIGWGSQRFVGPDRRLGKVFRLPVTVRFAEPIHPEPGEDAAALTQRLRDRIESELAAVQREYPHGLPGGAHWVPARLGGGAPRHEDVLGAHQRRLADWDRPVEGVAAPDDSHDGHDGVAEDGPEGERR
jgi:1-acyl-sn-glycerol-3-phosphate acyltransferase